MIVGSGIDLAEIGRIQQSIDRYGSRFLNRIFTAAEQAYCLRKRNSAESFAARFAAKEAGAKALGTGISQGVSWLEIEVVREHGRTANPPALWPRRPVCRRLGVAHVALSITHTADLAMASVVLENAD
jgi:holo-[acyl-carrier protein] synthase